MGACLSCGEEFEEHRHFCPKCSSSDIQNKEQIDVEKVKTRDPRNKVVIGCMFTLLVLFVLLGIFYFVAAARFNERF